MNPIGPASSLSNLGQLPGVGSSVRAGNASGSEGGFSNLVEHFVQQTNEAQVTSDQSVQDLVQGKTDNVQQVVLAVANAEMSFQLFMEIRNKLIDSYNELMRMQF